MSDLTPITREEALLDGADLEPITRKEQFIKRIYDKTQEVPTPITREEWFLKKAGEGGGGVTVEQLNATENGTYSEPGKAYSPVIVEVPQTTVESLNITANGTYTAPSGKAYSPVTVNVEGFKKKSIANTPTDIASFNDGTANPMPSLEISIEPVQSGSGDPSPENDRPISGWSGANVTRCEKNLFDKTKGTDNFYIGDNGSAVRNVGWHITDFIKVKGDITYHGITNTGNAPYSAFYDHNKALIQVFKQNTGENTISTLSGAEYVRFSIDKNAGDMDSFMVELGSSATAYSPYQGSTTSIPFHDSSDNPITVYGGTLNVTSGELTATLAEVDLGNLTWTYNVSQFYQRFYSTELQTMVKKPASDDAVASAICSNYPPVSVAAIYSGRDKAVSIGVSGTLSVADSTYTDAAAFKTAMNGVQLVYELATPITYQLTPAQVSTLLGLNNIFADCGQILEGEYFVTL